MTFDVKKHLIKVQGGKEYLPVAKRLVWMREEHPDWAVITEAVEINLVEKYAIFRATVMDDNGKMIGTGTKFENASGFGDFIEKAETGSIGRALAVCGYGTQFAPELDEGDRLADSPQPNGNTDNGEVATDPQKKLINSMVGKLFAKREEFHDWLDENIGVSSTTELTKQQAHDTIELLTKKLRKEISNMAGKRFSDKNSWMQWLANKTGTGKITEIEPGVLCTVYGHLKAIKELREAA